MVEPVPSWQCVLIIWGDKYPLAEINHLITQIRRHAVRWPRVVVVTDRERPGLAEGVVTRPLPEFYRKPDFLTGGCQAKLAMFEPGVVPDDLPAVFVDLDTVILGDLSAALAFADRPQTVAILQSAILPFGSFARALSRWTRGRRHARGNSSIVVYHPGQCGHIAARFRELVARYPDLSFRPMWADERFMSWANQPHMRAIPSWYAVKFPTEFMLPWPWLIRLRALLPWVRARRARLQVITFPGVEVKAETLFRMAEGATLTDRKGRRLIWSDAALGPVRRRIVEYYRPLFEPAGTSAET